MQQLSQMAKCKKDQILKLKHREAQCPPKTYKSKPKEKYVPQSVPRPLMFHRILEEVKKTVKKDNGHGEYSWREGMSRRNARRVQLSLTRRTMRMMREKAA